MAEGAESTKEKLLTAARHCLVELGHEGCTVKRIARQAGVNHGLVHHYFGGKEELFAQVLRRESDSIAGIMRGISTLEEAKQVLGERLFGSLGHQRFMFEMISLSRRMPRLRDAMGEVLGQRRQDITRIFGLRDETQGAALFAAFMGLAIQSRVDPDLPAKQIAEVMVRAILHLNPQGVGGGKGGEDEEK
ncbi:MAG: TetR/AcrR family transcriptional regulator [Deltaproteobacteria bacterium]|nr:TetR/AcrR family transcriptional regulator [Deltaproteobacteria bacterium]